MVSKSALRTRSARRPFGYGRLLLYSVLAGMVLGGVNAVAEIFAGDYLKPVQVAIVAVVLVAIMAASLLWWRDADEAVREAHKWAWFWGGSVGISLALIPFALAVWSPEFIEQVLAGLSPTNLFLAGIGTLIIPQMLGYGIAWAVWWLRRR